VVKLFIKKPMLVAKVSLMEKNMPRKWYSVKELENQLIIETRNHTITIRRDDESIEIKNKRLFSHSIHNSMLISYVNKLRKRGIIRLNADCSAIKGRDKSIPLLFNNKRADVVYYEDNKLCIAEIKNCHEIGLERTAQQLKEYVKHADKVMLVVPKKCVNDARDLLIILGLQTKVEVDTYD